MATQAQAELSRQGNDAMLGQRAGNLPSSRESRAVAAYSNLEPQPDSLLSLFA